jgi:hypothetical protein
MDWVEEGITLTEPVDAATMSVSSVVVDTVNQGRGSKSPRATVTVLDDQGNPVGGVTVTGDFTGDVEDAGLTGVTDGSGVATITSSRTAKGGVKVTFCVTDVTGGTLTWDGATPCAGN